MTAVKRTDIAPPARIVSDTVGLELRVQALETTMRDLLNYINDLHEQLGHIGIPKFDPHATRVTIRHGDIFNE